MSVLGPIPSVFGYLTALFSIAELNTKENDSVEFCNAVNLTVLALRHRCSIGIRVDD